MTKTRCSIVLVACALVTSGGTVSCSRRDAEAPTPPTIAARPPTPPPSVSLAFSVATRPPEWSSGYATEKLSDGDAASYWCTAASPAFPIPMTFRFPAPATVTGIVLDTRVPSYETSGAREYSVDVSAPATPDAWTPVASGVAAQGAATELRFPRPVMAGALRLTVRSNHGGPYAAIVEMRIMGVGIPSSVAVPTAAPIAPAGATSDAGGTAAAAPTRAPIPFAARLAASTPVVANPQPQTVGRRSFAAVACSFDGPPIVGESDSIGSLQPAPDGSIYLIDQDHHVRHYAVARGEGCRLTLDTAFGRNGILAFDDAARDLSIDRAGRVLASSGSGQSWWIAGGQVAFHCQGTQHGYTNVVPRGDVAFSHFVGSPIRRISYTDASCSAEDWTYENPLYQVHSMAVDARQVLLGGSQSSGSSDQVSVYTLDGRLRARMGGTQGSGPDGICWARRVTTCGAGICVADSNCHRLQMFDRRGGFVGSVNLDALLGVRTVWLQDLDVPRRGPSYASVSVARSGADSVYEGMIFRIDGI